MSVAAFKITSWEWNPRPGALPQPEAASIPEARVVELPPLLLSIEEAAKALSIGRTELFRLIREGRIRSIKRGRRRLIPKSELDRWIREEVERGER